MGIIYKATCLKCDYEEQFFLGGGFQSINLLLNIRDLSEDEQKKIRRMKELGEIVEFSVENKLTECSHCNTLKAFKEKTIIKIIDKTGSTMVYGDCCSSCGNKLHVYDKVDESSEKIICPKCRNAFLVFTRAGQWD